MLGQLSAVGIAIALTLPWTILAFLIFSGRPIAERLVIGIVGGLAATVSGGYVLALWGRLDLYGDLYVVALVVAVALLLVNRKSLGKIGRKKNGKLAVSANSGDGECEPFAQPARIWFAAALVVIIAAEAVPTFSTDFPIGWDPAFHSILSQKILDSNALAEDWRPFEDIEVNYSQGLHVLAALVSRWSGQQVHQTFQVLHLVIQPLAAVLVYLLAISLIRDWQGSVLAMLTYALLCNFGSFRSYYVWGGTPTEMGSLFFLMVIWVALTGSDRRSEGLKVLLFGSLILVHNLGAVIGTAVMSFYVLMTLLNQRGADGLSRSFVRLFLLTFVVYSFYIIPYALRAAHLESTEVLRFSDEQTMTFAEIVRNMGYVAVALGMVGLFLYSQRAANEQEDFLLCWFTSLVLCFCLLGYVYRFAANYFFHEDVAAFTPSRFLTVASYPLAIYGGYALRAALRKAEDFLHSRNRLSGGLGLGLVAGAIAMAAVPDVRSLAEKRSVSPEASNLGRMIRQQAPENAFIFYTPEVMKTMKPPEWIPYLTWRATTYTPIPASENRRVVRQKRRLLRSQDAKAMESWLAAGGFEEYLVYKDSEGSFNLSRFEFR